MIKEAELGIFLFEVFTLCPTHVMSESLDLFLFWANFQDMILLVCALRGKVEATIKMLVTRPLGFFITQ